MPPVHLQMKLAEPAVAGQPCLLRRQRTTALNPREILREDDAAFQFLPAGILAL